MAVALTMGIGSLVSYPVAAGRRRGGLRAGAEKIPGSRDRGGKPRSKSGNAEVDALIREARGQLDQIAAANDAIADPALSRQIEDIEATCRQILQRLEDAGHALPSSHVPALLPPRDAQALKRPRRAGSGGQRRAAARTSPRASPRPSSRCSPRFTSSLTRSTSSASSIWKAETDVLADMLKSDGLTAEPDAPAAKESGKRPAGGRPPSPRSSPKGKRSKWVNFPAFALVPEQGAIPQKGQPRSRYAAAHRGDGRAHRPERQRRRRLGFGARAQKEMGAFSDIALQQMLRQDIKPLESGDADAGRADQGLLVHGAGQGAFPPGCSACAAPLAEVQAAYEKAIPKINACADADDLTAALRSCATARCWIACTSATRGFTASCAR